MTTGLDIELLIKSLVSKQVVELLLDTMPLRFSLCYCRLEQRRAAKLLAGVIIQIGIDTLNEIGQSLRQENKQHSHKPAHFQPLKFDRVAEAPSEVAAAARDLRLLIQTMTDVAADQPRNLLLGFGNP